MPDESAPPADPDPSDPEDRGVFDRSARAPDDTWSYGAHRSQVVDAYLPDAAGSRRAAVLLVHGGFWRPEYDRVHLRPMAAALAALGFPALLVEYRRLPGDPDATTSDLRSAVGAIPAFMAGAAPGHASGLHVVGHSAGGHLALWLAAQPEPGVASCLALAPIADLGMAERLGLGDGAVPDFLGGPAARRPDLDPCLLPRPVIPISIVHGGRDSLVPIAVSRSYAGSQARIVELPSCAHFELIDPRSEAWPTIVDVLARHAAGAAAT